MPIYEYLCEQCGNEIEALQKLSEDPLTKCPACEAEALKKKISAAAFRLKGGGWYETDFKSGDKKNLAASDNASGKKAEPAGNGKAANDDVKKSSAPAVAESGSGNSAAGTISKHSE